MRGIENGSAVAGRWRRWRGLAQGATLLVLALGAGACSNELPPYGEALIIVDTDAAAPRYVGRMRLDLYTSDGARWFESRDVPLRAPGNWPASFSIYSTDPAHDHTTLVRVRIYPEGKVRDYHGERFTTKAPADKPSDDAIPARPVCDLAQDCELPRLVQAGVDVTPSHEPQPYLAIDRLIRVRLRPGVRGSVRLTLRGACFGTMADLAHQQTCVDTDGTLTAAEDAAPASDMSIPAPIPKDFGASVPCAATATPRVGGKKLHDEELCVPGGTYVFGNPANYDPGESSGVPERWATIPPFYLDKYEVTVARWRDALARGFKPPAPATVNDTSLQRDTCASVPAFSPLWCTYTAIARVPEDRESYPLSCVSWDAARAFCQFERGDLPTEAQWEYVAQALGREEKTTYPWGPSPPTCLSKTTKDSMVFKRLFECSGSWHQVGDCIPYPDAACGPGDGFQKNCGGNPVLNARQGPQSVDAADADGGDRSVGLGVVNLGGGLQEYTQDSLRSLGTRCWAAASLVSPSCVDPSQSQHTLRGDSWAGIGYDATVRRALQTNAKESNLPEVGFRCTRPLEAP